VKLLARTPTTMTPGTVVGVDDKQLARLTVIRNLLSRPDHADKDRDLIRADPAVVLTYAEDYLANNMIVPRGARPWSGA